ncbi:LysR family transcriptional regulator [Vibrio zhanjiangensis]|uniref:LysR family transcriptional regulator n=1 Tax=Vibrio zhanjiangensis TaxID=1046128 RepID=A0ABQ6F594_9VIBR|nr:LysR family transcriptional regulator [Vibrio zhanjiangensis]GLT19857.1 LysR family transcriptional regulator [Vibrio zhanjiangensis]
MLEKVDQQWLRSFHCVYENSSFKKASEFLGLPTSNVSRHIALLEDTLNTRLFNRTTRKTSPTPAGSQLYNRTHPLFEKLNDALNDVTHHSHETFGQLRVLMPDSPQLASAVVAFCLAHPGISLCCDTSLNPNRDLLDGFDVFLSFHRGSLLDSSWIAREIARWPSVVVAAPNLLRSYPQPLHISDLPNLPCISSLSVLGGSPWIFKSEQGETVTQKVSSPFRVNSGQLAKQGALAGLGVAILPLEFCQNEIDSGQLTMLTLDHMPEDLTLNAFYSSQKHLTKKVVAFIEHLQTSMHDLSQD